MLALPPFLTYRSCAAVLSLSRMALSTMASCAAVGSLPASWRRRRKSALSQPLIIEAGQVVAVMVSEPQISPLRRSISAQEKKPLASTLTGALWNRSGGGGGGVGLAVGLGIPSPPMPYDEAEVSANGEPGTNLAAAPNPASTSSTNDHRTTSRPAPPRRLRAGWRTAARPSALPRGRGTGPPGRRSRDSRSYGDS